MKSTEAKKLQKGMLVTVRLKAYEGMIFVVDDITLDESKHEQTANSILTLSQPFPKATFTMKEKAHDCDIFESEEE